MRTHSSFKRIRLSEILHPETAERFAAIGDYAQIHLYSLVLASQNIPHKIQRDKRGPFTLSVQQKNLQNALAQIVLYDQENPPSKENPPLAFRLSLSPLIVLIVPIIFTLFQFSSRGSRFYHTGISDAEKILAGDWWRPITALTLHGDAHHLVSNLISVYVVLNLLAFRLPLSRIAFPLVVASAIANFFVALSLQQNFRALGFSTFVFCALGALGAIEFRLMPRTFHGLLRRFAPLFSTLLLAVFLGIGEKSDILGHFYGFALGIFVGFLPRKKFLLWGRKPTPADFFLWILYFAIFLIAWFRAFSLSL